MEIVNFIDGLTKILFWVSLLGLVLSWHKKARMIVGYGFMGCAVLSIISGYIYSVIISIGAWGIIPVAIGFFFFFFFGIGPIFMAIVTLFLANPLSAIMIILFYAVRIILPSIFGGWLVEKGE